MKSDARRVSGQARDALRERNVRMVLAGRSHAFVAQTLGVNLRTVYLWMARYEVGGSDGLKERRRGRRPRRQVALTDASKQSLSG